MGSWYCNSTQYNQNLGLLWNEVNIHVCTWTTPTLDHKVFIDTNFETTFQAMDLSMQDEITENILLFDVIFDLWPASE